MNQNNMLLRSVIICLFMIIAGGTLADYIQKRCNSLLDEDTILHFFVQILLALYHVHNKLILHRDLKTQNILLDKHQMIVKIGDFGISKILVSKSKAYTVSTTVIIWIWQHVISLQVKFSFSWQVVGTPCYISPELCEGKPYNQKSDIWALGCVLYELASLKRAFEAAVRCILLLIWLSWSYRIWNYYIILNDKQSYFSVIRTCQLWCWRSWVAHLPPFQIVTAHNWDNSFSTSWIWTHPKDPNSMR